MPVFGASPHRHPYLMALLLVALTTGFGELVKRDLEPTNLVMFYLLIVVYAAVIWGRGPAIVTSFASVAAFDFFLVPPYLTFNVHDLQYLFTFGAFLIIGLVVSTLASRVREQVLQRQTEKLHAALLNSISHDLKTPLVSITGALTALLADHPNLDGARRRLLLATANEEANRLTRIVSNLLEMTKMEAGVLRLAKQPCDVRDLVGACLEQLKEKIGARTITINIPGDLPEVAVDFPVMLKALNNVVDNALKYSTAAQPIHIRAAAGEGTVVIEIRDEGIGISRDDLKRVFDKFYRVERAAQVSGTGLGLCITKGIVEAHGGRITADSRPGDGSIFLIELPLR